MSVLLQIIFLRWNKYIIFFLSYGNHKTIHLFREDEITLQFRCKIIREKMRFRGDDGYDSNDDGGYGEGGGHKRNGSDRYERKM